MSDENDTLPCAEKMAFDSKETAEANALAVGWQYGSKLKVYRCKYCDLWHLSSGS